MSFSIAFTYLKNEKEFTLKGLKDDICEIKLIKSDNRITAKLVAKEPIQVKKFAVKLSYNYYISSKVFVNGYQSWTDTREYAITEKMDSLTKITENCINSAALAFTGLNRSGDGTFHKYPRKPGEFYGFSYGYVRRENNIDLFGSLTERDGYTIITFDTNISSVIIEKDLQGKTFSDEVQLLDMALLHGEYEKTFDEYFKMMGVKPICDKRLCGYTTWYNYYPNINEKIVNRDLDALSRIDTKIDIFQIDDGYQSAIGDWLTANTEKFPKGMKSIADSIHSKDMLAGLWLAPFGATKNSRVYKEHPDWIICDENGKPYVVGPNWGTFYAIDIYNEEARKYIAHFFDVILNDWGYDMVKLDFLYAACVLPIHNKTRGEMMCDAMDFLRECCGSKMILGCGVPLMPAFGKVDFCRIGADIALNWRQKKVFTTREDVSTPHAVCNSIFRRHLDGRAFMNDPDVFLLRDNNIHMSFEQKALLAKINSLFGSLLFTSDNVDRYSDAQMDILKKTFESEKAKIISAEYTSKDKITVRYIQNNKEEEFSFNPNNGETYN